MKGEEDEGLMMSILKRGGLVRVSGGERMFVGVCHTHIYREGNER